MFHHQLPGRECHLARILKDERAEFVFFVFLPRLHTVCVIRDVGNLWNNKCC